MIMLNCQKSESSCKSRNIIVCKLYHRNIIVCKLCHSKPAGGINKGKKSIHTHTHTSCLKGE